MRILYHATPKSNMESILQAGIQPEENEGCRGAAPAGFLAFGSRQALNEHLAARPPREEMLIIEFAYWGTSGQADTLTNEVRITERVGIHCFMKLISWAPGAAERVISSKHSGNGLHP